MAVLQSIQCELCEVVAIGFRHAWNLQTCLDTFLVGFTEWKYPIHLHCHCILEWRAWSMRKERIVEEFLDILALPVNSTEDFSALEEYPLGGLVGCLWGDAGNEESNWFFHHL